MATYILLDPNEIVQQQQAMAVVAAAAANHNTNNNNNNHHFMTNSFPHASMPSKSSSSNDVSSIEKSFPSSHSSSLRFPCVLTDWNDFYLYCIYLAVCECVCVCVHIHSSYVYLANLHVVTYTVHIAIEPCSNPRSSWSLSSLFGCPELATAIDGLATSVEKDLRHERSSRQREIWICDEHEEEEEEKGFDRIIKWGQILSVDEREREMRADSFPTADRSVVRREHQIQFVVFVVVSFC